MALLKEIMDLVTCSPCGMTKLRGKAQHQFRCIERVRPFLVLLNPRRRCGWCVGCSILRKDGPSAHRLVRLSSSRYRRGRRRRCVCSWQLRRCAGRRWKRLAPVLCMRVTGEQLMAEGVEGGSREGAMLLLGPADEGAHLSFLESHCWNLMIDLFAAWGNALIERIASWTDELHSEQLDAFGLGSWNQSRCPCGKEHGETCYLFPPRGMELVVVRRAKSDGVRACFVVPTDHKAGYWKLLRGGF